MRGHVDGIGREASGGGVTGTAWRRSEPAYVREEMIMTGKKWPEPSLVS